MSTHNNSETEINKDPLDMLESEEGKRLLTEKAKELPTNSAAIEGYLESLSLLAQRSPDNQDTAVRPYVQPSQFDALSAVGSEFTADERAENFKSSGNEAYKLAVSMKHELIKENQRPEADRDQYKLEKLTNSIKKRYEDAFNYYSNAIEMKPQSQHILSQLYSNRAQIQMIWENFGYGLQDCMTAIAAEPLGNQKAYYRAATASLKLNKLQQALEFAEKGPQCKYILSSEVKQFHALQLQIKGLIAQEDEKQRKVQEENRRKAQEAAAKSAELQDTNKKLAAAIANRGLTVGKAAYSVGNNPNSTNSDAAEFYAGLNAQLYNAQATLHADSTLSWPVLFLYPAELQSDFIQAVHEQDKLAAHLAQMFPPSGSKPDWDKNNVYTLDNIRVYVEIDPESAKNSKERMKLADESKENKTDEGKVRVQIDPHQSLGAILCSQDLVKRGYSVPAVPTFTVLPIKK
jgi:hypothetical protein